MEWRDLEVKLPSGGRLAVQTVGSGMPLFLLHGFPLDATLWHDVAPTLAEHGCQVVLPDLRGFGRSSALPLHDKSLTIGALAEDIEQVRLSICPDKTIALCGLSLGGYVALEYWSRYAPHLSALILTNTKPNSDSPEGREARLKMADKAASESTWAAVAPMLEKLLSLKTVSHHPETKARIQAMMSDVAPTTIYAIQHAMANRRDFTSELKKIDVPTLVITGELDPISPPAENRAWSQEIPGAHLKIIADAAHLPPVETPAAFAQAVVDWLPRNSV